MRLLLYASVLLLHAIPAWSEVLTGPVTNVATGHIYYLLSQNTWPQSEAEAVELGGHLATIDDQAENDWVHSTFSMFGGQPRCLWIGYRRTEMHGSFSWASGSSSTFTNWSLNEHNDYFYGGEPEYFAFMWDPSRLENFRTPGKWNDVPEITTMDTIPILGVVEIARPTLSIRGQGQAMQINWTSHTNKLYQLEFRSSLAATNVWSLRGSPIPGNGSTNSTFVLREGNQGFHRVREWP
jgi:hypothetical protein